jgi:ribosomal protein S18 acetylase RimI-like enzyme
MRSFRRYLRSPRAASLPAAELTSMAVAPDRSRVGVGRALFGAFREHLRNRGIAEFKVSAATTTSSASSTWWFSFVGWRRSICP